MKSTPPQLDVPTVVFGVTQPEVTPITGGLVFHPGYERGPEGWNGILYAFQPDDEERRRIAAGDDFYIELLTMGGSPQPILVFVGKEYASAVYNVPIAP